MKMIALPPHPRFSCLKFHMCGPGNAWLVPFICSVYIKYNMAYAMLFEHEGQQYTHEGQQYTQGLIALVGFAFCDFD